MRQTTVLATGLILAAVVASCASHDTVRSSNTSKRDPAAALQRLADAAGDASSVVTPPPPPPPGLAPGLVSTDDLDTERATKDLATATAESLIAADFRPIEGVRAPEDFELESAMRLFVGARTAMIERRFDDAMRDLETVTRIDPTAARPWEALGEAQVSSRMRLAGMASLRRSVELGRRNPRVLLILALDAQARGETDEVVTFADMALESTDDPDVQQIAWIAMGQALHGKGHLAAGNTALANGLDFAARYDRPGRSWRAELERIQRARADLWTEIGDAWSRIGRLEDANAAYTEASESPGARPWALLSRRVYARSRLGDWAESGLILIDDMEGETIREDHIAITSYLAENEPKVGELVSQWLTDQSRDGESPTAVAMRVRAIAAGLPPEDAREVLLAGLEPLSAHPQSLRALLKELLETGEPDDILARLNELAGSRPLSTDGLADAVVRSGSDWRRLTNVDEPRGVLAARLLQSQGKLREAAEALADGDDLGTLLARGEICAKMRDWICVEDAVTQLRAIDSIEARIAAARVLGAAQRLVEAEAVIASIPTDQLEPTWLVQLGSLLLEGGSGEQAESLFGAAIDRDAETEQAYVGLIALYRRGGALADDAKLQRTVGLMRDAIPGSRALRLLGATEAAATGRLAQAQRDLLQLAEEDPTELDIGEALLVVWRQLAPQAGPERTNEAIGWIERRSELPGWEQWSVSAKARLLLGAGRGAEAEQTLREALETQDSPALRRTLASILGATGKSAEADAMLVGSLTSDPGDINAGLLLASIYFRQGFLDEAESELLRSLPQGVVLSRNQERLLVDEGFFAAIRSATPPEAQDRVGSRLLPTARLVSERMGRASIPLLQSAIILVRRYGSADDAGFVERQIFDGDLADADVRTVAGVMFDPENVPQEMTDLHAETLYQLGNWLNSREDEDGAMVLYRRAIAVDPAHAWASNNLAYALLERGERLDEVGELLTVAIKNMPNEASIIDSLGWYRYRIGIIENRIEPDGTTTEGAITLLSRAASLIEGRGNATITDHLGDAQWRSGDETGALSSWEMASRLFADEIRTMRSRGFDTSTDEESLRLTKEKISMVRDGKPPPVAPLFVEEPTP